MILYLLLKASTSAFIGIIIGIYIHNLFGKGMTIGQSLAYDLARLLLPTATASISALASLTAIGHYFPSPDVYQVTANGVVYIIDSYDPLGSLSFECDGEIIYSSNAIIKEIPRSKITQPGIKYCNR
jgi:hypothetical protein